MALRTSATIFGLSGWLRRVVIACSNLKFFCCGWLGFGSSVLVGVIVSVVLRQWTKKRALTQRIDGDQDQAVESSVQQRRQARELMRVFVAKPAPDKLVPARE